MYEDKELRVKVLNSTFYKEGIEFEGLLPRYDKYPDVHQLLSEYSALINQSEISEHDADRISEILELAEHDKLLDECIDKIDQASQVQSEIQCKKLSIEEFLIELIKLSNRQVSKNYFMESFAELVRKININPELINNFVSFKSSKYNTFNIISNSRFALYVNSWKPGQKTRIHQNFRYSTETLVYQGNATKTVFKRISKNGNSLDKPIFSKVYGEGEWISTNQNEIHQLANFTSENLVTIHFKYFNVSPYDREIDNTENSKTDTKSNKIESKNKSKSKTKLDKFLEVTH